MTFYKKGAILLSLAIIMAVVYLISLVNYPVYAQNNCTADSPCYVGAGQMCDPANHIFCRQPTPNSPTVLSCETVRGLFYKICVRTNADGGPPRGGGDGGVVPTSTPTPPSQAQATANPRENGRQNLCRSDINRNGDIVDDWQTLLNNAAADCSSQICEADFNGNSDIDIDDVQVFISDAKSDCRNQNHTN